MLLHTVLLAERLAIFIRFLYLSLPHRLENIWLEPIDIAHIAAEPSRDPSPPFNVRSIPMMDLVMLAIGFVFFALSIAYVYACDRL